MLHSANSELVLDVVEETVDFVFKADRVSDQQISKMKETITAAVEIYFGLAIEASANFDDEKARENCDDSDLLLLCLRIVEGIEAWGSDQPSKQVLDQILEVGKEEIDAVRYTMEDFK
tara:strand:- start:184 stop:537 length:354 start_codon:yes stop_codon:yes gene_type:complete